MSSIAERLRIIRGERAQKEFASTIGLKQTTYGKYERGVTSPSTETASMICQRLGLNPRWLILGEEPMYDAEASQERPRLKVKDLIGREDSELPADVQRSIKKTRKAMQAWGQEWERLPEWAKEEFDELYEQVEALTKERDEARAELLKAKDEAINAQNMALQSMAGKTDTLVDSIMKALEDKGFMYTTDELFEAMKSCSTPAELEKLIKQGRKK